MNTIKSHIIVPVLAAFLEHWVADTTLALVVWGLMSLGNFLAWHNGITFLVTMLVAPVLFYYTTRSFLLSFREHRTLDIFFRAALCSVYASLLLIDCELALAMYIGIPPASEAVRHGAEVGSCILTAGSFVFHIWRVVGILRGWVIVPRMVASRFFDVT